MFQQMFRYCVVFMFRNLTTRSLTVASTHLASFVYLFFFPSVSARKVRILLTITLESVSSIVQFCKHAPHGWWGNKKRTLLYSQIFILYCLDD